jgi:hypothetical protein
VPALLKSLHPAAAPAPFTRPAWMTDAMFNATSATLACDEAGLRQLLLRQQAEFTGGRSQQSLATLPVPGAVSDSVQKRE